MPRIPAPLVALAATLGVAALLSACEETRLRDAPDFGESVRQDVAAQIANPDAHYAGTPAPASNGKRVDSGVERYVRGKVAAPPSTETSSVGGAGGGGGGGSGGGGGGGGGSQ